MTVVDPPAAVAAGGETVFLVELVAPEAAVRYDRRVLVQFDDPSAGVLALRVRADVGLPLAIDPPVVLLRPVHRTAAGSDDDAPSTTPGGEGDAAPKGDGTGGEAAPTAGAVSSAPAGGDGGGDGEMRGELVLVNRGDSAVRPVYATSSVAGCVAQVPRATIEPGGRRRRHLQRRPEGAMTPRCAHPGLTLVELMVVMLLVALAAGAVAIRLHGPLRAAGFDDALDRIARHDAAARRTAMTAGEPVSILLSPEGTLQQVRASGVVQAPLELGRGLRVARMILAAEDASWRGGSVPVDPRGLSPDYALAVEDDAGQTAWLLCAGLSGQWTRWADEPAVRRLMQLAHQEQRP